VFPGGCAVPTISAPALALWLSNKTPDNFAAWITHQGNSFLVAVEQGVIVGVGALTDVGEITLNYVSPEARFRGVSRALLGALENRARQRGNSHCTLTSTETAHRFYHDNGYIDEKPSASKFSASGHPMSRLLTLGEKTRLLDVVYWQTDIIQALRDVRHWGGKADLSF
jgi:ribosomal protein S18 acetylase RimI-like enzyme